MRSFFYLRKIKYTVCFFLVTFSSFVFSEDDLKIVTLGTSLTKRGNWVASLENVLGKYKSANVNVLNLAISGATSNEGVEQLDELLEYKPSVVLMEFSVNDADYFRGISLSKSLNNLDYIIKTIRADNEDVTIILMIMNPVYGIRSWIRPMLGEYRYRHMLLARKNNIEYFDFRPRWMDMYEGNFKKVIPDGLHPTSRAAESVIVPVLKGLIVNKCLN
ncbi:SGNH/GDSL hydrolase family protein [Neptuniibacter sp. 2_MG-2023]|uniref:SGNH/GDSL hydrolase family protein n=1 Tax=Neptuniibacter sp. 2_MG-2023 TaxID=3062671 RepID=UPI0026E14976|nr:SGNH/GDSL hydrolase family protein [Neptuniibacter sp. 2_MG-2023]MDO6512884.1 SGNH/GDSL hydrolase family protein [Neptuniibacter sp. 2_MG-2023]